jgi:hypothetical protein
MLALVSLSLLLVTEIVFLICLHVKKPYTCEETVNP